LFQSGVDGSPFLTGENNIQEYVIAGPEMRLPEVANFLPFIEAKRQSRVRGYADGGAVSDMNDPLSSGGGGLSASSGTSEKVFVMMLEVLTEMKAALARGVVFTFEHMEEFEKMQNMLDTVRK
jgi:hypothetical protein